jgi:outer membrane protein OmpA-like peptidoglycan-associated protein
MNDPKDREEDRLDEMLTRLSSLANSPAAQPAAVVSPARKRLAIGAVGVLLFAAAGIAVWRVGASNNDTDNTAVEQADVAVGDISAPGDPAQPTPLPDGTAVITLSTEPPSVADPVPSASPDSTGAAPATTAVSAVEQTTTTTIATTTTRAAPVATLATPILTGVPTANLPSGQPWPNGLYQDDILYIRGTLPSQQVADALEARVAAILGQANVVNEVVVDPTVPMVETVLLRLGNSVLFKSGDFDVPPESELGFQLWALFLAANPDVELTIIGYTDNVGSDEYNIDLATKRANVARDRIGLTDASVLDRVEVVGLGPADPLGSNDTEDGRQLNRRVEFAVTGLFAKP